MNVQMNVEIVKKADNKIFQVFELELSKIMGNQ